MTLHDPLTILTLFDDCVQFQNKRMMVELSGEQRSFTREVPGEPNCRVAVTVDTPRAVALFMDRLLA